MARGIRRKNWSIKPPIGSQLYFSHPLTKGLVGCWIMNEATGTRVINVISAVGTGTFSTPIWSKSKNGILTQYNNAGYVNTGITRIGKTGLFAANTETFTVIYAFDTTTAAAGTIFARASATGLNRTFQNTIGDLASFAVRIRGTSTAITPAVNDGILHTIVWRWNGVTFDWFLDRLNKGTLSVGTAAEETAENISFGARTMSTPAIFYLGNLYYIYIYERALGNNEILWISSFPYDFFLPPSPRLRYFFISTLVPVVAASDESFAFSMS